MTREFTESESRKLGEWLSKQHLELMLHWTQCSAGWNFEPSLLKSCALILHRLGRYAESEPLLEQLYTLARSDAERFSALMLLSVGSFRHGFYVRAYVLALRAMPLNPSSVTPWLVAAAAAGQVGEESLLRRFITVFGRTFRSIRRFPAVVSALMTHPDLEAFTCSEPYLEELEDRVCEAAEWLQSQGDRKVPPEGRLNLGGAHPAEQLLLQVDEDVRSGSSARKPTMN
ncbi:hypothetical protein F0U59_47530 [Archangium gephyra]|nr:hypothetical protein F0U59_47530 [Archangium gephyra]